MCRMPVHGVSFNKSRPSSSSHSDGSITAHRTLIVRKLKGLEEFLPFTSVHWHMLEQGPPLPVTLYIPTRGATPNNAQKDGAS